MFSYYINDFFYNIDNLFVINCFFFLFSNIRMLLKKKDEVIGLFFFIGRMGVNLKIGIVGLFNVG